MNTTLKTKVLSFLGKFAPKEYLSVALAILISVPILIFGLGTDKSDNNQRGFTPVVANERVYNINGERVQLFDTSFYINYENNANSVELALVGEVLNEYLVPYHKLFDRHASYYAEAIANPLHPTQEELLHTPRITNLKTINDQLGTELEVAYPLYDLVLKARDYAIKSNGYFNPFVGKLYDFWALRIGQDEYPSELDPLVHEPSRLELERLVSFVPKTSQEINDALTFRHDEVNDKYYITLNPLNGATPGDLSLTLGGIAKGYLTDVMKEVLVQNKLFRGYINGGASSITTMASSYFGESLPVNMASIYRGPNGERDSNPSFTFSRGDTYSMSTSGTYEGKIFDDPNSETNYLRSHIINPFTGYPANHPHQLVSVISNQLTGTELEILSTSLIVMNQEMGLTFIRENYPETDFNIVYLSYQNGEYSLSRNSNFPGENIPYFYISERYREKILENI